MRDRKEYLKKGLYLPSFMRDFHDQKDLFKTIHQFFDMSKINTNWIDGHIYVIDIFLWFMGMHGYILQKSKADIDFLNLEKTIKQEEEIRDKQLDEFLEITKGMEGK